MPIHLPNGEGGLLAKGQLVDAVKSLPQYDVTDINDQRLLSGELTIYQQCFFFQT